MHGLTGLLQATAARRSRAKAPRPHKGYRVVVKAGAKHQPRAEACFGAGA